MSTEPNMKRRMLDAFQGVVKSMKWLGRQPDLALENLEAIAERMADPNVEDPFDLNDLLPAGIGTQMLNRWFESLEKRPDIP